jgi:hypothetical protein
VEVISRDQVIKHCPEWLYDMQQSINSRCVEGNIFVSATTRMACLRHKTIPEILTGWQAESDVEARCIQSDGRVVVTQANGQVCFLKLHHGNRRITLAETKELLRSEGTIEKEE